MTDSKIHWIRTYHSRQDFSAAPVNPEIAMPFEIEKVRPPFDFFDIQSIRGNHFRYAQISPIHFRAEIIGMAAPLSGAATVTLLQHKSGFVVFRLTLTASTTEILKPAPLTYLERSFWDPTAAIEWQIGPNGNTLVGNPRTVMNYIFLSLHERCRNRLPTNATLISWAAETQSGCERIHELVRRRELNYPFPVGFGVHIEIRGQRIDTERAISCAFVRASDNPVPIRLPNDTSWRLAENISILWVQDDELGGDARNRVLGLLEFLALQRAAMRTIQRDTQRVLTEAASVTRKRIDEWRLLLATTTDDYVLHDHVSGDMSIIRDHLAAEGSSRDPRLLEQQVRSNITSFQSRLDTAGQQVSSLIGALFGVVAAVLTLGTVLKLLASRALLVDVEKLPDVYPVISIAIDLGVVGASFFVATLYIRLKGSRLPAPTRDD